MFHIHTKNDLVYLASDVLENSAIAHGFSTRKGGVSPTPWDSLNLDDRRGDDLANVQENFRRLCTALDTDVQRAVLSRQVHRSDVRRVTAVDCGKGLWRMQDYDSADALITDVPHIPLVVFSADCGIILLYDPVRRAVGAAHAGWRGAAAGIVYKTVRRMQETFGTDPRDLRAAIGAAIGPCCFETDADVPASTPLSDRISRDLKKRGFTFVGTTIVYSLLQSAGLVDDHLKGCGWHVSCRPPE